MRNLNDLKPIIVFGGSEGGISMINVTRDYALEGFAALNVAYFAYDGLPKYCAEIPLEYFEEPIEWMLNQEYVKSSSIALHGVSKGSELSLLLASEYPEISVVIAMSATNVIWPGFGGWINHNDSAGRMSSWTKSGKPLPYMDTDFHDSVIYRDFMLFITSDEGPVKSISSFDYFKKQLTFKEVVENASIPINEAHAAILLVSGGKDEMWPSSEMSESIIGLLKEENYQYPYKHIIIENQNHYFDLKEASINGTTCWSEIIDFINHNQK